jgi:hypothetical protein
VLAMPVLLSTPKTLLAQNQKGTEEDFEFLRMLIIPRPVQSNNLEALDFVHRFVSHET